MLLARAKEPVSGEVWRAWSSGVRTLLRGVSACVSTYSTEGDACEQPGGVCVVSVRRPWYVLKPPRSVNNESFGEILQVNRIQDFRGRERSERSKF